MSRALKQRGFTFVGSTICYSFMQATGMVNDHLTTCFRYCGRGQDCRGLEPCPDPPPTAFSAAPPRCRVSASFSRIKCARSRVGSMFSFRFR